MTLHRIPVQVERSVQLVQRVLSPMPATDQLCCGWLQVCDADSPCAGQLLSHMHGSCGAGQKVRPQSGRVNMIRSDHRSDWAIGEALPVESALRGITKQLGDFPKVGMQPKGAPWG